MIKTLNTIKGRLQIYDKNWVDEFELRQAAIQVFLDIIKHQKNPFNAFMEFFNLTHEEIAKEKMKNNNKNKPSLTKS